VVTDKALIKEMDEIIINGLSGVYNMYMNDDMVKMLAGVYESNPAQGPGSYDPRLAIGGMGSIANRYGPPFLNAPVVILIAGDARAIGGAQINVGICGENMNLAALALGLGACWVGFSQVLNMAPQIMEKLGLQPPWSIISSIVLGHPRFRQQGMVPREFRPITWFREGSSGPETEE
jgi:nitroreductase